MDFRNLTGDVRVTWNSLGAVIETLVKLVAFYVTHH